MYTLALALAFVFKICDTKLKRFLAIAISLTRNRAICPKSYNSISCTNVLLPTVLSHPFD